MEIKEFEIQLAITGPETIKVRHSTETFDLELKGTAISLINNGDNSWSIVKGDIDQETANLIGEAIEQKVNDEL